MAIRIEDVKAEGIAIDIDRLAASGFESISEADRYRLKHQGVCAQRHVGAFMMRIRVPGGKATAAQLRRTAELATESLRLVNLRYQGGASGALDVVDAQSTLVQAQNAYIDAQARFRAAVANLQTLTGNF